MKRIIILFTLAVPAMLAGGCDNPDTLEPNALLAEEEDDAVVDDLAESDDQAAQPETKPSFEGFDLEANMTPTAGPAGKCCKAICTWQSGWQQLPWPVTENCNDYARKYCGYYNLVDAQWRTCG